MLSACKVTTQDPAAIQEVQVSAGGVRDVRPRLQEFASRHGMTLAVSQKEIDFGTSYLFELKQRDVELLVSNPFGPRSFTVTGYAKKASSQARAKGLVQSLADDLQAVAGT
jgi:hypothetical protein